MKRDALRHPKMLTLAGILNIPRTQAIGIVQVLLDYCADVAPEGDIGKWKNEAIANACEWPGNPDFLVLALVESGWLDMCTNHRLVWHGLSEHSESWWKAKLSKIGKDFAVASPPKGGITHNMSLICSTRSWESTNSSTNSGLTRLRKVSTPSTNFLTQGEPHPPQVLKSQEKVNPHELTGIQLLSPQVVGGSDFSQLLERVDLSQDKSYTSQKPCGDFEFYNELTDGVTDGVTDASVEDSGSRNFGSDTPSDTPSTNLTKPITSLNTKAKKSNSVIQTSSGIQSDLDQSALFDSSPSKDSIDSDQPKKKSAPKPRFKPPKVEEVAEYCAERRNGIDAEEFVSYYDSVGWVVGKNRKPMTNWKSSIVVWEKKNKLAGDGDSTETRNRTGHAPPSSSQALPENLAPRKPKANPLFEQLKKENARHAKANEGSESTGTNDGHASEQGS